MLERNFADQHSDGHSAMMPTVVDRMQHYIDLWEAAVDQRVIFLSCYSMMTRNMLTAIERGEFDDAEWVSTLLHRFADYYFDALDAYDQQPEGSPAVWQFTFESALRPGTHVLQHLILGVNAHICFDLVFALVDVLRPEWEQLSDEGRQMRYRDHCRVNDVIYRTIDAVQDQVVERFSPAMNAVDHVFGTLDEWLLGRLITNWREQVWAFAAQLMQCDCDADSLRVRQAVELQSMKRAQAVLGQQGLRGLLDIL